MTHLTDVLDTITSPALAFAARYLLDEPTVEDASVEPEDDALLLYLESGAMLVLVPDIDATYYVFVTLDATGPLHQLDPIGNAFALTRQGPTGHELHSAATDVLATYLESIGTDTNLTLRNALVHESLNSAWTYEPQLGGNVTGVTLDVTDHFPNVEHAWLVITAGWDGHHVGIDLDYVPADPDAYRHAGVLVEHGEDARTAEDAARAILAFIDRTLPYVDGEYRQWVDGSYVEIDA